MGLQQNQHKILTTIGKSSGIGKKVTIKIQKMGYYRDKKCNETKDNKS
jgi:hypothetical protein